MAQLKSGAQHGPAAKAVFFLTGAFLPDFEHGSGIGDCVYGGGCCPEKDNGPTPLGRLSSFRRPGRAALNLTWRGEHEIQAPRKDFKRQLLP